MKITKNINLDKYKKAIDNLSSATNMANIANETIIEIQHRTQSGNNIKGINSRSTVKSMQNIKLNTLDQVMLT